MPRVQVYSVQKSYQLAALGSAPRTGHSCLWLLSFLKVACCFCVLVCVGMGPGYEPLLLSGLIFFIPPDSIRSCNTFGEAILSLTLLPLSADREDGKTESGDILSGPSGRIPKRGPTQGNLHKQARITPGSCPMEWMSVQERSNRANRGMGRCRV